jgi:hypothetical protein
MDIKPPPADAGGGNRHITAARGNQIVTLANWFF